MTTLEAPPLARRGVRVGAVLLGALDGLLGIALPFAVLAALAVVAWAGLGSATDWSPFVRAAAVVQLLGHGVDVRFSGPPAFTATVALIGPALVTAVTAIRAGRRAAHTAAPLAAWAGCVAATAVASAALLLVATSAVTRPVAWQAVLLPTALVAAVALLALRHARGARPLPVGVRAGVAAALLVLAAAAALVALLLIGRFGDVVVLYESLHAGPAGGIALTSAQVLALPVFVVWAAAWMTGGGVALGAGSITGPFASQIGPLPAVPLLGAIPGAPGPAAAALLLVPALAGFAAAALARRSGVRTGAVPLGATTGLVAGTALGLLAAASSGAAGPGRLAHVGPDALVVAGLAALEIGVPAMLGAAVLQPRAPEASEAGR